MHDIDQAILTCAEAVDARDYNAAKVALCNVPITSGGLQQRLTILSLWRSVLIYAVSTSQGQSKAMRVVSFLDTVETSLRTNQLGPFMAAQLAVQDILAAQETAGILIGVLADVMLRTDDNTHFDALELVMLSQNDCQFIEAWRASMAGPVKRLPMAWHFQPFAQACARKAVDPVALAGAASREDLVQLFQVFVGLLASRDLDRVLSQIGRLATPEMRTSVVEYLMTSPTSETRLPHIKKTIGLFGENAEPEKVLLFDLRCAASEGRWQEIVEMTDPPNTLVQGSYDCVCLRALALVHLGRFDEAQEATDFILIGSDAPWYVKGRALLVRMRQALSITQRPQPNIVSLPDLPVTSGRPLAQALWVGRRLRWIEELSIASFLHNGWRYQLYVYDIPENVPVGVELLDASAILPRERVFSEGKESKVHVGSLGAFSDLFRYALLELRGGMWTDTDVINLRRFEPEAQRFISTERTDVGLVGPNGAMMAMPAEDPMMKAARTQAEAIIDRNAVQFSSIGPDLLADLIGRHGFEDVTLMPPDFLNPVSWLETGSLLGPPSETAANILRTGTPNLHVYTETWKQFGLGMSQPPSDATFLGKLHAELVRSPVTEAESVAGLLESWGAA